MNRRARIIFWPFFLVFAISFGVYAWRIGVEQRCARHIRLLGHPHADVAAQAWWDLRELYYTKWAAVNYILAHLDQPDDRPISFLIQRELGATNAGPDKLGFTTRSHPIYYRNEDKIYCSTVHDAILAFMYDERKWKVDFDGDWKNWWDENRGYYGRP